MPDRSTTCQTLDRSPEVSELSSCPLEGNLVLFQMTRTSSSSRRTLTNKYLQNG